MNAHIVDVIKEGEIVRMSENQAIMEDLFILRRVVEPEKETYPETVKKESYRFKDIDETRSYSRLQSWRAGKLSHNVNDVASDLIDNFHWEIVKLRRSKGLSRREFSKKAGVTEEELKRLEFGELPKDNFRIISKIENCLGISLRKEKKPEGPSLADLQKMGESRVRRAIERAKKGKAGEKGESVQNILGDDLEIL